MLLKCITNTGVNLGRLILKMQLKNKKINCGATFSSK